MVYPAFLRVARFTSLLLSGTLVLSCSAPQANDHPETTVEQQLWRLDSLERVGGHPVEVSGDPQLIQTPYGTAVAFDGDGDRLLVDHNPLGDAESFTVEVIFKPNDVFPENWEPRFFHIEAPDNSDRRITVELRLNDQAQWYLDGFIKSEISAHTLIDENLVHPTGEWAHAALTYHDGRFTSFVNGQRELSGEVVYQPIGAQGQSSIGARMNQVHWFNGAMLAVRTSPRVLEPHEFLQLDDFR